MSGSNIWSQLAAQPNPKESIGRCKNAKNCRNYSGAVLGDGYCVRCWDIGYPHLAKRYLELRQEIMSYKPVQELVNYLEESRERYVYECMPGMWRKDNGHRVRPDWVMQILGRLTADTPSERNSPYRFLEGQY